MKQYLEVLRDVLRNGDDRTTRPDEGTAVARALFVREMRFDMSEGFPIITTKRMPFKMVAKELLWMISGSGDNTDLQDMDVHIWDANANENSEWLANPNRKGHNDLGRIYGVQWRHWRRPGGELDQLAQVIKRIKATPYDRRHIVTAWNPGEIDQMALPPCHMFYQFFVAKGKLSMFMFQRSCDMFLGVPFNITSYSLLLHIMAQVTGLEPGEFIHTLGDTHIYHEHFDAVREQLRRKPRGLPTLSLNPKITDIDSFTPDDMVLEGYKPAKNISARMPV